MKRWWPLPSLLLLASAAVATIPPLREAAVARWRSIAAPLFGHGEATDPHFDTFYAEMVQELPLQERAERALELAVNRYQGASDWVLQQAPGWTGQIKATPQLDALVRTASGAPLIETRMAGFELFLAAYGISRTREGADRLYASWEADPAQNGPWMMWALGALAARGIERERIHASLLDATADPDVPLRKAAVNALAVLGGSEVIDPLLAIGASDPSPLVRERAFCGLASSGTLLIAERYQAVPGLLAIAQAPASDARTRGYSFQALKEISGLHGLPDDPQQWRERLRAVGLLPEG